MKTIKDLRTEIKNSKIAKEKKKTAALLAILDAAQKIAKADKNREVNDNDLKTAAKAEKKAAQQSKDAGAPYNEITFDICATILPTLMTESETITAVNATIINFENPTMRDMGKIMGILAKEYGELIDKGLASQIIKQQLS